MEKGIFQFVFGKEEVHFFSLSGKMMSFNTLDEFLDYNFGYKGATFFTTLSEINALYHYVKEEDIYVIKKINISSKIDKIIGISVYRKDKYCTLQDGQIKYYPFKTFYDIKYKIGSDELSIKDSLKLIEESNFKTYNQGYTSKLRKQLNFEEKICGLTINNPPSMAPIIYAKTCIEYDNVKCFDITSAYPYLMTQALPHYDREVIFETEEQFNEKDTTYYGSILIENLAAKQPYYPLTLVGKNNKGITVESQGKNITHEGVRIIAADQIILNGFLPDLIEILKRNYNYSSYKISKKVIRFTLQKDAALRNSVLKTFEVKQEKKRNKENYAGEKILLNRLYGFLITVGSKSPAHYGQYVVSQERLIMDRMIHKIGLKDVVQSHTDSIKFEGNHAAAIEEYNNTIEFPELGRFMLEDEFQKCVYFSNITGKYIDKNGQLGLKHGGIDKKGIGHLYKKSYEEINMNTKYYLIHGYFYLKGEGYFPNGIITDFNSSVDTKEEIK